MSRATWLAVRSLRAAAALATAVLATGCVESDPAIVYEYDPAPDGAFPDKHEPVAVPPGGMGIVTDSLSDEVSLLDLGSGDAFAAFPVGRDPVGLDGPHHIAVDPAGGFVYIGLSYPDLGATGPHAAHGSGLQPGYAQKLSLKDFRILGQVRVDYSPGDIVVSDDGARVVVSHFDLQRAIKNPTDLEAARSTLAVIDPATLELAAPPQPPRITVCIAPHGVTLSHPAGSIAYVACYGEDAIAVVDLDAGEVLDRVPVSAGAGVPGNPSYGPYSATLSPDGAWLAVGDTVSKDVRFLDVAGRVMDPTKTIATGGAPYFVGFSEDGALLYIPTQSPDSLLVIDVAGGGQEVARRDFLAGECIAPHLATIHGADTLMVVCEGDHVEPGRILWLDRTTLATVHDAEVGVYPDALAMVPGGGS